jgi:hypothetical protein
MQDMKSEYAGLKKGEKKRRRLWLASLPQSSIGQKHIDGLKN